MADENKALVNMLPEHNKLESTDRFLGSGASEEFLVNLDDLASAVFEKIKSKFGAAAFLKVANNDTTTASGYVADARAVNALGKDVDELNSSLKSNFGQSGGLTLTNSTYYPTSYIYRSGQMVYLRCAGITEKEIKAGTELTIAVENTIPAQYRPHINLVFYGIVSASGKILRVYVDTAGKITFTAQDDLASGFGINLHICFHTGKAAF